MTSLFGTSGPLAGAILGRPDLVRARVARRVVVATVERPDGDTGIHVHTRVLTEGLKRAGMQVIAGAPNIVRGGSHSGNVNAVDLLRADAVDAFASDYVPASLVEAVFLCADKTNIAVPDCVALVTDRPARMAGLTDRGRLATGLRADIVRVRLHDTLASVRAVWRQGERVA